MVSLTDKIRAAAGYGCLVPGCLLASAAYGQATGSASQRGADNSAYAQGAGSGSESGSGSGSGAGSGSGDASGSGGTSGSGSASGSGSGSNSGSRSGQGSGSGAGSSAEAGNASGTGGARDNASIGGSAIHQQGSEGYAGGAASAHAGQGAQIDQMVALELLLGNHEEIELARLAQKQATTEEARKFAEMMIADHEKAIAQLRQMAPSLARIDWKGGTASGAQGAGRTTGANGAQGSTNAQTQAGGDPSNFHQEVARRCLELTRNELTEHQGPEFDMAYMGQQVGAHLTMLAKLQASEQVVSGELKSFVTQAIPMVEHHRSMAKDIKKMMMAQAQGQRVGAQPAGTSAHPALPPR